MPDQQSEDNVKALIATAEELRKDAAAKTTEALKAAYDAEAEYMKASSAYSLAGTNYALGRISASDYSNAVEAFVKAAETWTKKRHWADAANNFLQNSTMGLLTAQTQLQFGQFEKAEPIAPGVIELLKASIRYAEEALI